MRFDLGDIKDAGLPGMRRCFVPGDRSKVARALREQLLPHVLNASGLPRKHIYVSNCNEKGDMTWTLWVKEGCQEYGCIEGEVMTPTEQHMKFQNSRPIGDRT